MPDLRILIVSKDMLSRAALAAVLGGAPGIEVVGQLPPGNNPADEAALFHPDAILFEMGPETSGPYDLITALQEVAPVVALLSGPDNFPASWEAGARGHLLRDVSPQVVTSALVAAANGNLVLGPELAEQVAPRVAADGSTSLDLLSPREREVLLLLAGGLSNKAIAGQLLISEHTVKFHVNSILRKLGAQSRTEAAMVAARSGLIPV
ncbi:MAG: response regulator transcription factor [Anaerolineales bacterium]|jgi:DNA-binding NarL/FixJ family response regulator